MALKKHFRDPQCWVKVIKYQERSTKAGKVRRVPSQCWEKLIIYQERFTKARKVRRTPLQVEGVEKGSRMGPQKWKKPGKVPKE